MKNNYIIAAFAAILFSAGNLLAQSQTILNVSYDPTRELYEEFNKAFVPHWKQTSGKDLTVKQSHGGSGKQARAVIDGLAADVVTLALAYDIDEIAAKAGLLQADWQKKLEHNSAPYTSTVVFLVRKGNPKAIKDWADLIKDGVQVITPNPKTSGGARWNYLAAFAYALRSNSNDEAKAKEYVGKLFKNVPVLDTGARGSTTTFVQRNIGDVLITWENEAYLALKEFGNEKFEIISPALSILAEPTVALVEKNAEKNGTTDVSLAYLKYLYSDEGQRIAAKNFYRPANAKIAAEFASQFQKIELIKIDEFFGGWAKVHTKHFSDGGIYDQIYNAG